MSERRRRFEAEALPHLDAAYNLARWLAGSASEADDVVQEAMLRAYRSFEDLSSGNVKAWLLAIVRNCHLTAVARRSRLVLVGSPAETDAAAAAAGAAELGPAGDDPLVATIRDEEAASIDEALARLPEELKEILVLREMEELSYREIATILGAPIGTVMSRLSRARAALRACWRAETPGEHDGLR